MVYGSDEPRMDPTVSRRPMECPTCWNVKPTRNSSPTNGSHPASIPLPLAGPEPSEWPGYLHSFFF